MKQKKQPQECSVITWAFVFLCAGIGTGVLLRFLEVTKSIEESGWIGLFAGIGVAVSTVGTWNAHAWWKRGRALDLIGKTNANEQTDDRMRPLPKFTWGIVLVLLAGAIHWIWPYIPI